jgi:hypothetical protein
MFELRSQESELELHVQIVPVLPVFPQVIGRPSNVLGRIVGLGYEFGASFLPQGAGPPLLNES